MHPDPEKTCFIILPGFAPDSIPVLPIQKYLESQGYAAHATNFWGDGQMDFAAMTIDQCRKGVASAISGLRQDYPRVIGIGISLGGALLIEHSKEYSDLDQVVSIGTPFRIRHRFLARSAIVLYPAFNAFWKLANRITGFRPLPVPAMRTVWRFLQGPFLENLDRVATPILFLQSRKDEVADCESVGEYVPSFSHADTDVIYYDDAGHDLGYDGRLILEAVRQSRHSME